MVLGPVVAKRLVGKRIRRGMVGMIAISSAFAGALVMPSSASGLRRAVGTTHLHFFEPGHTGEGDFAYAPSSITDGDRQYHFYCGNQTANRVVDSIYLVTYRAEGSNWVQESDEQVLTRSTGSWDSSHVCDPSVTKGEFEYDDTEYEYAMFYTGTQDPDGNGGQNSVGVAFSNDLVEWVKYPEPVVRRLPKQTWGAGQPSAVTMDGGDVYLFYTRSDPTRTVWRRFSMSAAGVPLLGPESRLPVTGTQNPHPSTWSISNADFAYDSERDRFWMVKPASFDDAPPAFVSTAVELLWIDADSISDDAALWHSVGTIDSSITDEAKNHNAGLQRTPEGHLDDSDMIRINLSTSPSAEWPLSLFGYNLSAVTVPVDDESQPASEPAQMRSINPYRAIDTRTGYGGKLTAGETRRYKLSNTPADATAVTLNVTVDQSDADGYVLVWDCDAALPETSNLNYVPGDTRANQVTVPISPETQEVCFYTWQPTHLVVDVFGWYGPAGGSFNLGYVPRNPVRIYDSRDHSKFAADQTREFNVSSYVPAEASAVTFNLTTTEAESYTYATVWPCDQKRPQLSSLNTALAGQDRANQVTVKLDGKRSFCVYSSNPQHLIIDVTGSWVSGGDGGFVSQTPAVRWIDTRATVKPLGKSESRLLMPEQSRTVVGQLTATKTLGAGNYGLYPCNDGYGGTSTVNFVAPDETASVAFYMRADRGGICVRSDGGGDVILDVNGYLEL